MKSYFCSYQERILAAIRAGAWPHAAPDLCAHVETCNTCNDFALVAQTLRESRNAAMQAPPLPSPGLIWWRAQVRRRNAAIERMTRPIALAEKVALLIVFLAAVALVAWQYPQWTSWLANVWGPLSNFAQLPGLLALGLASLVVFGGVAIYLLKAKE